MTVRFAALGDSLTEGLGDPVPGGWRGWAALLAAGLAEQPGAVELLNCARSGALTADVAEEQLARALGHRPQLAAVIIGANDTLRGAFDITAVAVRLDTVFAALAGQGAVLLTACLPDPGRMLGLPWPLARPLGRRMRAVNDVVHALSERYGAVHLHTAGGPWTADRAAWSVDRLHPSELGHRLLARQFHRLLAARGLACGPEPQALPQSPPPRRGAAGWWMATRGTRWVADRCADLLPDLLRLAAAELRYGRTGAAVPDRASQRAAARALAALPEHTGPGQPATGQRRGGRAAGPAGGPCSAAAASARTGARAGPPGAASGAGARAGPGAASGAGA